jgi:methyl-accepting chemotaxis protein
MARSQGIEDLRFRVGLETGLDAWSPMRSSQMMFRNLKTRPKMLLGFSIPILLMAIVAYVVSACFQAAVEISDWVQHTHEVIAHGNGLAKLIVDMETGERGFLITGKEEFLEPFEASQKSWSEKVDRLAELVSDNPEQVKRVKSIDALAKKWLEVAARPEMETRRRVREGRSSIGDIVALVESRTGKQIIDSIREKLDGFIGVETDLMKIRTQKAEEKLSYAITITIVGTGIAILLVVLTALLISGSIARDLAVVVQGTKALASGDLNKRIQVKSKDEIGQLGNAFNTMAAAMANTHAQLLQAGEKLLSVQDEERRRIARELHDESGSALTALIVNLQNIGAAKSVDQAKAQIENVQQEAVKTLENVRRIAHGLHPLVLEQFGLAAAVEQYVNKFASSHVIKTQVRVSRLPKNIPYTVSTTLFRILQEALTNIAKHADAREVSVVIDNGEGSIVLVVEDDGNGFDEEVVGFAGNMGLGLRGIKERVSLLNGTVEFEPTPGTGTTLYVTIPAGDGGNG